MTDDLATIDRRLGEIRAEIESIPRPIFWGDPDQIRLSRLREEEKILAVKMIACLGGALLVESMPKREMVPSFVEGL